MAKSQNIYQAHAVARSIFADRHQVIQLAFVRPPTTPPSLVEGQPVPPRARGRSGKGSKSRLAAAVVFFLLVAANSGAWGETRVVFTVDVESTRTIPLPAQVDAVCKDGSACGLMEIARMLKERGLAGTFFLSVFEYSRWGKAAMRNITVKLQTAGQDVELHTHPESVYDPLRTEMYQYSLGEQTAIIRDGAQLLRAWTGKRVAAHRAGDYSADERTLDALVQNGILIDSSLFWGHPHCRLTGLGLPLNLPASRGRLVEVPVTVYQREERSRNFGDVLSAVTSLRKIDANWFIDEDEARAAIDASVDADIPILVIFLHSFSFLAEQSDGSGVPAQDRHARAVLQAILDRVSERRLPVVTMRDLADSQTAIATVQDRNVVPSVTVRVGLRRYVWHRLRPEGSLALPVVALLFLAAGVVLVAARLRKSLSNPGDRRQPEGRPAPRSEESQP